jgi:hypothetical protein
LVINGRWNHQINVTLSQIIGNGLEVLFFVGEIAQSMTSPTKNNSFTTLPNHQQFRPYSKVVFEINSQLRALLDRK